jgi:predicted RNase H-like nuclease
MNVRLIGIDCATEDARTGVAYGRLTGTGLAVQEATQCSGERNAIDTVVSWLAQENTPTLLAIDAPLGWPTALSISLSQHTAGEEILTEANAMFRRYTDRFIEEKVGKTPLSVGADRIARTAHSALKLLGALRRRCRCDVPLAWSPDLRDSTSAIEVYPAATLLAHTINASRYKKARNLAERNVIINSLRSHLSLPQDTSSIRESADALDALVCLLAGADFLRGQAMPPSDPALAKKEGWIWVCPVPKGAG